ncbi:protamine-2 isoform X2 [Bos taurus]|nr:protamine-2 isoform X2 [Bos taurus]
MYGICGIPGTELRTDPTNTVNSKSRGQASASSPSPQGQLPSQPESPTRDPSITMVRCHVKSPTESPPGQQGSGQQGETEHPDQARELRPEDIPVYGRTHRGRYHYRHRSHTRRRPYRRRRRRACRHRRRRRGCRRMRRRRRRCRRQL